MKEADRWKLQEPDARLSAKQRASQMRGKIERAQMESKASQTVKLVLYKTKLWTVDHYSRIALEFKQPLSSQEIRRRMHMAFPELEVQWEESQ